jgi:hypothetical protein
MMDSGKAGRNRSTARARRGAKSVDRARAARSEFHVEHRCNTLASAQNVYSTRRKRGNRWKPAATFAA